MTSALENMSALEVGERLRKARDAAGFTQASAAVAVSIARTTLVAIEQGLRPVRLSELRALAKIYKTTINEMLRSEAVSVELTPKFRKLFHSQNDPVESAVRTLSDLAKAEIELEGLLGVKRIRNYPPERPILSGDVRAQAEQDALELRQWLGLGSSPIADLTTILEMELGVRVYVRRLDSRISGLFAYDEALGACIMLNASHPRERRSQTAAHELGHLVSSRREAEILESDQVDSSREERYANAFGIAFLMPVRAVMQKFKEVTLGADKLTRRHVIVLAHAFGVSREAIVRRLEELKLTKQGTWDWFEANGKITDEQAREVLGDLVLPDTQKADARRPTTLRLALIAGQAWRRELLSEGQLMRMLHVDRVELRKMLDDLELDEGSEADGSLLSR
jgi:Zn-dependent peptidase ImmA (M78 family)/DNA-binding XRE family transcriptional regulator